MQICPQENIPDLSNFDNLPADIYQDTQTIVKLAHKLGKDKAAYTLPFCQTLEGRCLGADVKPNTPRFSAATYNSCAELPQPQLTKALTNILKAIPVLAQEKEVICNLTGPLTTFSSIVKTADFYRNFRKDRLDRQFREYQKLLLEISRLYQHAGASVISYADPCCNLKLLGKKNFTRGWQHNRVILNSLRTLNLPIHLCPRLTADLDPEETSSEQAQTAPYLEHIMANKDQVISGSCIKQLDKQTNKILKINCGEKLCRK